MYPDETLYPSDTLYLEDSANTLKWNQVGQKFFETGLDKGVLYPKGQTAYSLDSKTIAIDSFTFSLTIPMLKKFTVGLGVKIYATTAIDTYMLGTITSASSMSIDVNVVSFVGSGTYSKWSIVGSGPGVVWNGLTSVDESGSESAKAYYLDGRPFLFLPTPKEFTATIKAYTYPDEFSEIMGLVEATDGMYLDSQQGSSFDLSYRTRVGNDLDGVDFGYKIHLIYNATVSQQGVSYASTSDSVNPTDLSWDIQAVPVRVAGYRPTAHVVIDTRHMNLSTLTTLEAMLYGDGILIPTMPDPQVIFDLLHYSNGITITDNGDGTWSAEGSYDNVYMIDDGVFKIDNVETTDNGDGTYDVTSTL